MRNRFMATFVARFFTVALVLLSAVALQAQGLQQKIEFYLDGKVGTEVVKKGSYTISYPDADQGTLEVKIGKKIISSPFTRQPADVEAAADKMSYRDNADGTRSIASITPRGKKFTLVLP
ncbi:MAG: hypothetical protein ABI882_11775 [Acidobacteriota bacterium]